jgi:hypothetical protein
MLLLPLVQAGHLDAKKGETLKEKTLWSSVQSPCHCKKRKSYNLELISNLLLSDIYFRFVLPKMEWYPPFIIYLPYHRISFHCFSNSIYIWNWTILWLLAFFSLNLQVKAVLRCPNIPCTPSSFMIATEQ